MLWQLEGKREAEWWHTAFIVTTLHNIHATKAKKISDFHPAKFDDGEVENNDDKICEAIRSYAQGHVL